jgi:hypothetical protein
MIDPSIIFKHIGLSATKQRNDHQMISDACFLTVMMRPGLCIKWCQSPSKTFDHQIVIKTFEPHLLSLPKEPKQKKTDKAGRKPSAESNILSSSKAAIKELNSNLAFSSGFFGELMNSMSRSDWKDLDQILFLELDGSLSGVLGFALKNSFRYLNIKQKDDRDSNTLIFILFLINSFSPSFHKVCLSILFEGS